MWILTAAGSVGQIRAARVLVEDCCPCFSQECVSKVPVWLSDIVHPIHAWRKHPNTNNPVCQAGGGAYNMMVFSLLFMLWHVPAEDRLCSQSPGVAGSGHRNYSSSASSPPPLLALHSCLLAPCQQADTQTHAAI